MGFNSGFKGLTNTPFDAVARVQANEILLLQWTEPSISANLLPKFYFYIFCNIRITVRNYSLFSYQIKLLMPATVNGAR